MYGAGDVRVIDVPDPTIGEPTDAVVRIVRACVCGSDLHPYHSMPADTAGGSLGTSSSVSSKRSAPRSPVSAGRLRDRAVRRLLRLCEFCRAGLQTSCVNGGFWKTEDRHDGGQAEAIESRWPTAPWSRHRSATTPATRCWPSLLTLSDVYGTGWHAAVRGGVTPGRAVTVIGDGAVGLLAVLSARQLGAERIVLMGRHKVRTDLGREFGATDVVAERGEEGIATVRDLTGGGSPIVLEAVGHLPAYEQAVASSVPAAPSAGSGSPSTRRRRSASAASSARTSLSPVAPPRSAPTSTNYCPAVLERPVQPGKVFDRTVGLEETPKAYAAMDAREALKVAVEP